MEIETKAFVPENVRKRCGRDKKLKEERTKKRAESKKANQAKIAEYSKRAEKYAAEYASQDQKQISLIREAKSKNSFYVPAEAKVFLVVRIRGITCLNPQVRKILQLFRLRQLHNAAFVRINKATINMLRKVEPYITYGFPSRKLVSDLVYKRGYAKINGQRIPLTTNHIVEETLGKKIGCICVEDVIHEIVTCGTHFKEANNFLWPFKLTSPRGGFEFKRHPYHSGGAWGNREEQITPLVRRML